jgi:hypothetical protein
MVGPLPAVFNLSEPAFIIGELIEGEKKVILR